MCLVSLRVTLRAFANFLFDCEPYCEFLCGWVPVHICLSMCVCVSVSVCVCVPVCVSAFGGYIKGRKKNPRLHRCYFHERSGKAQNDA